MAIALEVRTYPAFPAALPSARRSSSGTSNSSSSSSSLPRTTPRTSPIPTRPPPSSPIPHNVLARAYTKHIIHIFGSARYPYPALRSMWQTTLPIYIAYILSASGLPAEVGMTAMVLLFRYKDAVPHSVAYGDDAARLFLAAYIVAAKVVSDVDLEPKVEGGAGEITPVRRRGMDFWFHVSLKRFPVEELRRMELEFCRILRWDVQVSREAFMCLQRMVYRECQAADVVEETQVGEEGAAANSGVQREERIERPPPPYYEAARDTRVLEMPTAEGRLVAYAPARPRPARTCALMPYADGMYPGDIEDRWRFGRIFEESLALPMETRGSMEPTDDNTNKSLFAVFRERVVQIVACRPALSNEDTTI